MDRGSWWAAVHGVTESGMTKRLTHVLYHLVSPNANILHNHGTFIKTKKLTLVQYC